MDDEAKKQYVAIRVNVDTLARGCVGAWRQPFENHTALR